MARSSVKIGIIMLLAWAVPLLGILLSATGLALAVAGNVPPAREMARAGIFLNTMGLILAFMNMALSIYLLRSGFFTPLLFID